MARTRGLSEATLTTAKHTLDAVIKSAFERDDDNPAEMDELFTARAEITTALSRKSNPATPRVPRKYTKKLPPPIE